MSSHASRVWITRARSRSSASCDLGGEDVALRRTRRVVVVVVEPALPHGDHLGFVEQLGETVDPVLRVVRMHARGGPDAVVGARNGDGSAGLLHVGTDGDHAGDAGRPRRVDRLGAEPLIGDVAVGVSPHGGGTGARPSRRRGHPGTGPTRPPRAGAARRAEPGRPIRRHSSAAVDGMAGDARMATIRSTSSASPSTAATSRRRPRPSTARWPRDSALVSRISRQVASSASLGATRAHAAAAAAYDLGGHRRERAVGVAARRRRRRTCLSTTVATRESRLPRLLARSEL